MVNLILCMFNDCKSGDHKYSIRCCDCHDDKCPERCKDGECESCHWAIEVKDEERSIQM